MLLNKFLAFEATTETSPYLTSQTIHVTIDVDRDSNWIRHEWDTKSVMIPAETGSRTGNSTAAYTAVDTLSRVFNVAPSKAKSAEKAAAKTAAAHDNYRARLASMADAGIEEASIVLRALDKGTLDLPESVDKVSQKILDSSKVYVAFEVEGSPQWWTSDAVLQWQQDNVFGTRTDSLGTCALCGHERDLATTLPKMAWCVFSFNESAWRRTGRKQGHSAPICGVCAAKVAQGGNILTSDRKYRAFFRETDKLAAAWAEDGSPVLPIIDQVMDPAFEGDVEETVTPLREMDVNFITLSKLMKRAAVTDETVIAGNVLADRLVAFVGTFQELLGNHLGGKTSLLKKMGHKLLRGHTPAWGDEHENMTLNVYRHLFGIPMDKGLVHDLHVRSARPSNRQYTSHYNKPLWDAYLQWNGEAPSPSRGDEAMFYDQEDQPDLRYLYLRGQELARWDLNRSGRTKAQLSLLQKYRVGLKRRFDETMDRIRVGHPKDTYLPTDEAVLIELIQEVKSDGRIAGFTGLTPLQYRALLDGYDRFRFDYKKRKAATKKIKENRD